jgi:hypothetical protein
MEDTIYKTDAWALVWILVWKFNMDLPKASLEGS